MTIGPVADKAYIKSVPSQSYDNQVLASVLGVVRALCVPLGATTPDRPNISSTVWRTMVDHKKLTYYFDMATRPNLF